MNNKGFTVAEFLISVPVGLVIITQVVSVFGISTKNLYSSCSVA